MIKQFYCIVDAGGNIYEHTFDKTEYGAKFKYLYSNYGQLFMIPIDKPEKDWKIKEELNGDRVILCGIDTKEEVKISFVS